MLLIFLQGIAVFQLPSITTLLHDTGFVVWHDVPKLRNVVIIDPQWFADAMASFVTFICQDAVSKQAGLTDWGKMKENLKFKYVALTTVKILISFMSGFPIQKSITPLFLCLNILRSFTS